MMKKLTIVLFLFLALAMQACGSTNTYVINSDSMSPTIENGATVTVEKVKDGGTLKTGDIVLVNIEVGIFEDSDPVTAEVAMMIATVNEFSSKDGDTYVYTLTTTNSSVIQTVYFEDIIGLIVDIQNP